jgi:hypothetical protein
MDSNARTDLFNLRWIMSAGYIDEKRCVKKFAVCHCDFLMSPHAAGVRRGEDLVPVVLIFARFYLFQTLATVTRRVFLSGVMQQSNCLMRSLRGRGPSGQRLMIIIRIA